MSSTGTTKIDRAGLTDEQYIAALELSNETMAEELQRIRMALRDFKIACQNAMSNCNSL